MRTFMIALLALTSAFATANRGWAFAETPPASPSPPPDPDLASPAPPSSTSSGEPAPAPPPPAPPEEAGCLPTCREGYVCLQGRCLSACNPPCAAGEICAASGICQPVAPPPQVAPPPPPPASPRAVEVMVGVGLGVLSGTYKGPSEFESGARSATSSYPTFGSNIELGVRLGDVAHFFAGARLATNLSRTDCILTGLDVSLAFGGTFYLGPEAGLLVTAQKCGTSADITKGNAAPTPGGISFGDSITAVTVGARAGLRLATGRRHGALVPELRLYTNAVTLSSSYVSLYPDGGSSDTIQKPNIRWYGGTLGLMYAF